MIKVIAQSDSVSGRDLPPMIQYRELEVTQEQYEANKDILKLAEVQEQETAPAPKKRGRKPKAKTTEAESATEKDSGTE